MQHSRLWHLTYITLISILLSACNGSDNNDDENPFQEQADQGATRYLGEFTPMLSEVDGDTVNHRFSASDGPMCLRGTEYTMATRDQGAEDLMIFLQGGGACWANFPNCTQEASPGIPKAGILDPELAGNPVADWNVAYFPYCDGGVHASDIDYPADATDPEPRFHHGLQNLSAGLDVTARTFPNPRRILLTGVSGGGFGTIFALPLVRSIYPGVPIELVNDSGVAVGRPDEPEFFEDRLRYWNINDSFLPKSCPDCIADDGNGTNIHLWALERDPNLRLSLLSYTQDGTIAGFFFAVPGPIWEMELRRKMGEIETAQPDRLRSFIAAGNSHTFLLSDTSLEVEGISVLEWLTAMLDDSAQWTSRAD